MSAPAIPTPVRVTTLAAVVPVDAVTGLDPRTFTGAVVHEPMHTVRIMPMTLVMAGALVLMVSDVAEATAPTVPV